MQQPQPVVAFRKRRRVRDWISAERQRWNLDGHDAAALFGVALMALAFLSIPLPSWNVVFALGWVAIYALRLAQPRG